MPEPTTTGGIGTLIAGLGGGGTVLAGLITWARRITGRVSAVEVVASTSAYEIREEKKARRYSDDKLSTTIKEMADQNVAAQRELHQRIDESTKATSELNATMAQIRGEFGTGIEAIKERLDREHH